jgi:Transposase DDE domain group 1
VTGLTREFSDALAPLRQRRSVHDPGRVLVDVAVVLADGGDAISDLGVLRDQPELFGPVASTATAWRVLDAVDEAMLIELRRARAVARERSWTQRDDVGRGVPAAKAAGRELRGLVFDLDATLIDEHSDTESAAATFKGGFGYHPLLCWLDNTGEALAGRLRPGNAGAVHRRRPHCGPRRCVGPDP